MANDTFHSYAYGSPLTNGQDVASAAHGTRVETTPNQFAQQRQLALAEEFIRNNTCNSVGISDIADAVGINVRALQRLFRKYRGVTPIQMLLNRRISAAHEMIAHGHATSVRDLAAKLHFSNPGRFSKLYRRTYSAVPSERIRAYQHEGGTS
jgi:transcriptional regulator GlxA family with amidase domain